MEQSKINMISTAVNDLAEDMAGLLQDLIRIPSYSGEEREIVEFIKRKMAAYQFDQVYHDKLGNAVGRLGKGPLTLMYDAHIDTVAVTENEDWAYPPFAGKIENGMIYGRGAVDEKAAMAGYLVAARVLQEFKSELPFTLYVVGSVLEEDCDGYPLLHLIEKEDIRPDYVLLGEPTDLAVYRGQRGRMEVEITARGKSAHGAHNHEGINAVYKMNPVISAIEKLDRDLKPVEPLGKGSITVSRVTSHGPSLCSVPDTCSIHIDRRMTKGETKESILQELKAITDQHDPQMRVEIPEYKGKSWTGLEFKQEAYFPTWIMDDDHPIVKAGLLTSGLAGGKNRSGNWGFSTNGVATAGRLGIPTIGFAPGLESLAHTSREEIRLADLVTATRFYALFPFMLAETLAAK